MLAEPHVFAVGSIRSSDTAIKALLVKLGTSPLGFQGSFTPVFFVDVESDETALPVGITMYLTHRDNRGIWPSMASAGDIIVVLPGYAPRPEQLSNAKESGARIIAPAGTVENATLHYQTPDQLIAAVYRLLQ